MYIKTYFTLFVICLFFYSCSSNSATDTENTASQEIIEEIETLDSLNQEIEENTQEIEENIKAVEEAISDLDDSN